MSSHRRLNFRPPIWTKTTLCTQHVSSFLSGAKSTGWLSVHQVYQSVPKKWKHCGLSCSGLASATYLRFCLRIKWTVRLCVLLSPHHSLLRALWKWEHQYSLFVFSLVTSATRCSSWILGLQIWRQCHLNHLTWPDEIFTSRFLFFCDCLLHFWIFLGYCWAWLGGFSRIFLASFLLLC
jgi:hypothetical protein